MQVFRENCLYLETSRVYILHINIYDILFLSHTDVCLRNSFNSFMKRFKNNEN